MYFACIATWGTKGLGVGLSLSSQPPPLYIAEHADILRPVSTDRLGGDFKSFIYLYLCNF